MSNILKFPRATTRRPRRVAGPVPGEATVPFAAARPEPARQPEPLDSFFLAPASGDCVRVDIFADEPSARLAVGQETEIRRLPDGAIAAFRVGGRRLRLAGE